MASNRVWPWTRPGGQGSMIPASERTETMVEEILRVVDRIEEKMVDAPAAVPIPDDVLNTIIRELMDAQAAAKHGIYIDDEERVTDIDAALAWLDAQGKKVDE
jgi:hypothetical protein